MQPTPPPLLPAFALARSPHLMVFAAATVVCGAPQGLKNLEGVPLLSSMAEVCLLWASGHLYAVWRGRRYWECRTDGVHRLPSSSWWWRSTRPDLHILLGSMSCVLRFSSADAGLSSTAGVAMSSLLGLLFHLGRCPPPLIGTSSGCLPCRLRTPHRLSLCPRT